MILLDYSDRRPIYEQIIARIQDLILKGALSPDAPLPSVRSLATDLSINPNTIQRAYQELERTGWIYSVRGKGSFAAEGKAAKETRREEFAGKLRRLSEEAKLLCIGQEEFLSMAKEAYEEASKGKEAGSV